MRRQANRRGWRHWMTSRKETGSCGTAGQLSNTYGMAFLFSSPPLGSVAFVLFSPHVASMDILICTYPKICSCRQGATTFVGTNNHCSRPTAPYWKNPKLDTRSIQTASITVSCLSDQPSECQRKTANTCTLATPASPSTLQKHL